MEIVIIHLMNHINMMIIKKFFIINITKWGIKTHLMNILYILIHLSIMILINTLKQKLIQIQNHNQTQNYQKNNEKYIN